MPAKNSQKTYVEGGYYHIYNRGVEKREIFSNDLDFAVFINYLKQYLSPQDPSIMLKLNTNPDFSAREKQRIRKALSVKNYNSDIQLLAYCLMPNHFHLFLKQTSIDGIDRFMSSLGTRYTMYFNRSHNRVGKLYQGVYKAVLMTDEAQYLHITRYIHKQALNKGNAGQKDFPSSFPEYQGLRKTSWVHPEEILSFFSNTNPAHSYETFVAEYDSPDKNSEFEI